MDHMGEAVVDERMESLHKDHCWEEGAGRMLLVHAISLKKKTIPEYEENYVNTQQMCK